MAKQIPAKLPLPPAETAMIRHNRGILATLIDKGNELALALQAEAMEEIALRKEARAAARAAAEAQAQSPAAPPKPNPKPHQAKPKPPNPNQDAPQAAPPTEPAAEAPQPRRRTPRAAPEAAFFYLVRAITTCMRMDAELAERLVNGHTTAEIAGLNHPARQPILDYLHKAAAASEPFQLQRMTHNDLETRITQELAWAPNRNPGDIIAQIATQYGLEHNPDDYPNNWRPAEFHPPPDNRSDDRYDDPPPNANDAFVAFMNSLTTEFQNKGLI